MPKAWGARWTTSANSAAATPGWRGGKSGLAPASGPHGQPGGSGVEVAVDPGADGLGASAPQQAGGGDVGDGGAVGDLEDGGGAFADVGLGMVVADLAQFGGLGRAES